MPARLRAVAALLLLSGACALIYQAVWLRELKLIFGASTPATAAVLAIFIGGLGLGNALLGPRADVSANPLRLYAQLEFGAGILALLTPLAISLARAIYIASGGQEAWGAAGATLLRLVLAALILGPPTFLMGGTLPAAAKAVESEDDLTRRHVGLLYGLNTIGAVLGTVLSTFWLLEWLGTRTTLWAACAVNLLTAAAAWRLSRTAAISASVGPLDVRHPDSGPAITLSPLPIYAVAALSGFTFFLMELVWYRLLSPILGGTTFTFGLILAVALAGIGLGGALYAVLFRSRPPGRRDLALALAYEALALAIPFAIGDQLAILAGALRPLGAIGFTGHIVGWLLITAIVVFPAACVSGFQFSLLVALLGPGSRHLGTQLGRALAWNSVGAMAGAIAGGFGLLALLSATGAWRFAAVLLALLAVALLALELRRDKNWLGLGHPFAAAAAGLLCLAATGPTAAWRHSGVGGGRATIPLTSQNDLRAWLNTCRRNIVWQADGRESSVALSSDRGLGFVVNGKSDGHAINDAGTQVMLGALGAMLHPQPRSGLVIGLGTGESAGWLAHQDGLERVDVVEIEPAILEVAQACAGLNHDVLNHPKLKITIGDARETLLTTRTRYDLIASEPSNPYRGGVSSLYTREFYAAARERLQPGGIFLQWLQGYEIDVAAVRIVLGTLTSVFPHVEIWETSPADLVLVCSSEPLTYTSAEIAARMQAAPLQAALRLAWRTVTVEGVLAHLIATDSYAQAVVSQNSGLANTDDRNLLEYRFARSIGKSAGFTVSALRAEPAAVRSRQVPRLAGQIDWEAVEDARIAYHAAAGDAPLSPVMFTGARARRAEALLAFQSQGGLSAIAQIWDSQPQAPRELTEILAVALGAAARGQERALTLVEPIRTHCPREAQIVGALLAARQNRPEDAALLLAAVFNGLRTDATPLPGMVDHAIRVALEIAAQDSRQIPRLFAALREPFALRMVEENRTTAVCLLANALGPREAAGVFAELEPHPQWNARMLELRLAAYESTRHPLARAARRDLTDFLTAAGEAAVLASERQP